MISYGAFMGLAGFGITCYHNVVRKIPAMRRPWEHVVVASVFYYVGSKVPEFKEHHKRELQKIEGGREALAQATSFNTMRPKSSS